MTRVQKLVGELDAALTEARGLGFECPTTAAREVASSLLRHLAATLPHDRALDVAVGEDGTIEISASSDASLATVDVSPSGNLMQLVVRDLKSGIVSPVASGLSNAEVARRIERAA